MSVKRPYCMIDLFSGAGGLSQGFAMVPGHRFRTVWANDIDIDSAESYTINFDTPCKVGDINAILANKRIHIPKADIVIGGPPCQGFSLLNKKREGDARRQLWRPFLEVVHRTGASTFVMENVPQLLGSEEHREIIESAKKLGFEVASAKLTACDYGVPQTRTRAFIIGCRSADPATVFPPKRTHWDATIGHKDKSLYVSHPKRWATVRDAIGKLPPPEGIDPRDIAPPLDLQFGRRPTEKSLLRYAAIPEEGMNRFDLLRLAPELTPECWVRKKTGSTDLFGRLWWDKPSVTIRTEFFKPEKGRYLHPQQDRPITHREAARLQSFPDTFRFVGSKTSVARQIGNAVPPLLAEAVAQAVLQLLDSQP